MIAALPWAAAAHATVGQVEVIEGDVLVGVDDLGRVLIAADEQPLDGRTDYYFLFTDRERIGGGPWSERGFGQVLISNDSESLRLVLPTRQLWVSLAVEGREPVRGGEPPPFTVIQLQEGIELVNLDAESAEGAALDSLDVADLSTWPQSFVYDLLDPASGPCADDSTCTAGGQGSTGCSIGGCPGTPHSCSASCGEDQFACCKCWPGSPIFGGGYASCRCLPCIVGP